MPSPAIGIDIGHTAVRAVAIVRTKAGYAIASHAVLPRHDASGDPRPLPVLLSELDNLIGLRRGDVTVADSAHTILVRFISTIPMPPERLAKLLRLELAQHADQSGGELAADTYQVPIAGDELIHGCAMGQPAAIHGFLGELSTAGIAPRRIHVGAAALFNATLPRSPVEGDDFALLVDIGSATTRVTLFGEGRLLAFRQIAIGGDAFTAAIAESRGIPTDKAEQLKQHWALAQAEERATRGGIGFEKRATQPGPLALEPDAASAPTLLEDGEGGTGDAADEGFDFVLEDDAGDQPAPDAPPAAAAGAFELEDGPDQPGSQTLEIGGAILGAEMTRTAETLFTQLSSTMSWFRVQLQMDRPRVTKVLLSGGGAALVGLDAYLQRRFDLPVERFDPCAPLAGAHPESPHEYATAIGLALSETTDGVRLDLLPESLVRRRLWHERLIWPYVGAAALVAASALGAWTLFNERGVQQESLEIIKLRQQEHERLAQQLAALQREKDLLAEDLKAIASRIYFNRDLLYVIRVMKEQAPKNPELWVTRLETVKSSPAKPVTPVGPGPGRVGRPKAEPVVVDRGVIEIAGLLKFDREVTAAEITRYFNDYIGALDNAVAGEGGPGLFDKSRTVVITSPADIQNRDATDETESPTKRTQPFGIRLIFQPTQLDQAAVVVTPEPAEGGR